MKFLLMMLVVSGLYMYVSSLKHLLLMLLSLEFMVVGVFSCLVMTLGFTNIFVSVSYLIFTTCEAALGLGILISMARVYGSDYSMMISLIN